MSQNFVQATDLGFAHKEGLDRAESMCELVVFTDEHPSGLVAQIQRVIDGTDICGSSGLKWISYHSQDIFNNSSSKRQYRAVAVAYGELELKRQLSQLVKMIEANPHQAFSYDAAGLYYGFGAPEGKMAFVFPGQAAQYVRMGEQLAQIYPRVQAVWDELGAIAFNGKTLQEMVFPNEPRDKEEESSQERDLARTDWSMPSINLVSESIRVLLDAMSIKPDAVASHSAGDAASYCAAGVISAEQMVRFAGFRGVHAAACPMASKGGMLMVFAGPEKIQEVLKKHNIKQVWIATYNLPTVTLLSGILENLDQTRKALSESSIRSKPVANSAAPHCPLSLMASNRFMEYIAEEPFHSSNCEVYSYLFGEKLKNDPDLFKKVISVSCLKPVRFVDQINQMHKDGVRTFVEVGPSDSLTMLIERILGDKPCRAFSTNKKKGDANYHLLSAVAELIRQGRVGDTSVLWESYKAPTKPYVLNRADLIEENSDDIACGIVSKELDRLRALDLQLSKINRMVNA